MPRLVLLALIAWGSSSLADAFSFTAGKAVQCGDFTITWEGGTPPFTLLLTPPFGTPQNISIPPTAFNNGQGSFTSQLIHLNQSDTFLITMSDSTGFNAGGTSGLITTEPSEGGSCDTQDPGTDFLFQTPTTLQQCRPFTFTGYIGAQLPITGLIPGGQAFIFTIPPGASDYDWPTRLYAGTSVIFSMVDSAGRLGGATDTMTVGRSDDSTCLVNAVPSTTIISSSSSPTPTDSSTPSPTDSIRSAPGHPTGAIAGGVIGVVVLLAAIVAGAFFCLRSRRKSRGTAPVVPFNNNRRVRTSQRIRADFDLVGDKTDPFTGHSADGHSLRSEHRTDLPPGHEPDPFMLSPLPPSAASQYHTAFSARHGDVESTHSYPQSHSYRSNTVHTRDGSRYTEPIDSNPFDPPYPPPPSTMTAAERKRAQAGVPYTPSRFIVHTDIEDESVDEDGVVELPPQYTDRRIGQDPFNSYSNLATPSHSTPALHLHSQDPNAEDGRHLPPQP